jgi:hypothetical protein
MRLTETRTLSRRRSASQGSVSLLKETEPWLFESPRYGNGKAIIENGIAASFLGGPVAVSGYSMKEIDIRKETPSP